MSAFEDPKTGGNIMENRNSKFHFCRTCGTIVGLVSGSP